MPMQGLFVSGGFVRRFIILFLLVVGCFPVLLHAQEINWKAVDARRELNTKSWPRFFNVTGAEQAQMRALVLPRAAAACKVTVTASDISVSPQPLAPGHRDFLVSAGEGCDQDGTGAQWIVEFTAGRGRVLGEVEGFLSHLEPALSHGLHDVVMSRHAGGACCYTLSYYRYDGAHYRLTGAADVRLDENGRANLTPREVVPGR